MNHLFLLTQSFFVLSNVKQVFFLLRVRELWYFNLKENAFQSSRVYVKRNQIDMMMINYEIHLVLETSCFEICEIWNALVTQMPI